jgi:hypothetical protein
MEEDKKTVPQFLLSIMVRNPFEALPGFAGSNPGEAQKSSVLKNLLNFLKLTEV